MLHVSKNLKGENGTKVLELMSSVITCWSRNENNKRYVVYSTRSYSYSMHTTTRVCIEYPY